MNDDALDRLEQLFRAAQLHPPEERAAFLDAACADDDVLRAEILALLAADADADSDAFLADRPADWDALAAARTAKDTMEGEQIGPYRVLRPLGHGGMGDVYLAVREAPFRRYVALKVIRRGTDSREVLARFAVERQILASLDHPGIARLIDGGVTDDGRPYFAMEYVEGQPITAYCDERRLTVPERLRLFTDVCAAVHVAHQNLVLHRDLKPSNILVTARGEVKLLDFGIAKLLNPQLSHLLAPITRAETRMLTPEYASPEQVRGEPLTTTSDVYSLGVLLYELLTGRRPHHLDGRSTQEMIRIVSDEPPVNPSTAVTRTLPTETARAEPAEVASARALTTERLQRRLRGDLDAICLKALRKEPNQRYGSAELLAQDVERHLDRQPVAARRGNRRYRFASFLRRHRVEATAAAAVLIALVGGLGVALWQAGEVRQERDRAQLQAKKAEEVTGFLLSLFERADPTSVPGDTIRVREVLEHGAALLETRLAGQPAVQAELFPVLARAYSNLGRHDRAADLTEQALALQETVLGATDTATVQTLYDLAELRATQEQFAEAEALFRTYAERVRATHGEHHSSVLRATYRVWEMLHHQGRRAATDSLFTALVAMERALPEGDDPDHAYTLAQMGLVLQAMRQAPEAEAYFRRALAMEQRLHRDEHPHVAYLLTRVAGILNAQERFTEAEPLARKAVTLNARLFPEGHEQAASGHFHLGNTLAGLDRKREAETHFRAAIAMLERIHGPNHRYVSVYRRALDELPYGPRIVPHGQSGR